MSSRATKTARRKMLAARSCRFCGVAGSAAAWSASHSVCAVCAAMRDRGAVLHRDRQAAALLGVSLLPGLGMAARFRFARERDRMCRFGQPERVGTGEAWGHLDVPAMRARVAARWPLIYSMKESL
jgi:hypothetical protein